MTTSAHRSRKIFNCASISPFDLHRHHRAACTSKLQGIRQLLHDNLRDWIIFLFRAGGLAASHHDVPQHREDGDEDGRGKQGDILIEGQGGIFGHDTVLDVSRPHTHTAAGELKATALQTAAASKYRKHHAGYRALGIGFVPFIVDSLGRLHDDAQRILWHLAGRHAMYGAVAGVRQRMPPSISTGIPADGGRHLHPRGATTTCNRQWAFHDPEIGTGFDLGGG